MLAIRLQRTGRSGHAQYRIVVQDSRLTPLSGKVVAQLGQYNPHTKQTTLDSQRAAEYLNNGAQPSERVVGILKEQGVKLPKWVTKADKKQGKIRHPEKLRRNRPATDEAPADKPADAAPEPVAEPAEAPAAPAAETAESDGQPAASEPEAVAPDAAPEATETAPETDTADVSDEAPKA